MADRSSAGAPTTEPASERVSVLVQYEMRVPVHFPDGVFVHVSTTGRRDPDCGERVGSVLIRVTAEEESVASDTARLCAERIAAALARAEAAALGYGHSTPKRVWGPERMRHDPEK